jgi:hypothetical protein
VIVSLEEVLMEEGAFQKWEVEVFQRMMEVEGVVVLEEELVLVCLNLLNLIKNWLHKNNK